MIKLYYIFILLSLCIYYIKSYCPNGCSGHGTCGVNDRCTCYLRADKKNPAYTGGDCSLFTCPKGEAWIDVPTGTNTAHALTECSNRGICDRSNGNCKCFVGFEGMACERTQCPNGCSGHGVCKPLAQLSKDYIGTAYNGWDASKVMGCACDAGFRGPSCSLKECPSGPDVLGGKGAVEGRECGGRGACNREKGVCECYHGYFGTICDKQSTVA